MAYLGHEPVKGEPILTKSFVGDGIKTTFQLGFVPSSTQSCYVSYNGLDLYPYSEYNCDTFGNIIFKSPPEANVTFFIRCDQVATYSSGTASPDAFTKRLSQTIIVTVDASTSVSLEALPNQNACDVYRNQLILDDGIDYFINNNIIQFYYPLNEGDKIKCVWFE